MSPIFNACQPPAMRVMEKAADLNLNVSLSSNSSDLIQWNSPVRSRRRETFTISRRNLFDSSKDPTKKAQDKEEDNESPTKDRLNSNGNNDKGDQNIINDVNGAEPFRSGHGEGEAKNERVDLPMISSPCLRRKKRRMSDADTIKKYWTLYEDACHEFVQGISDIEAPKQLESQVWDEQDVHFGTKGSHSDVSSQSPVHRGDLTDFDDAGLGLVAEDYYASLFARCDPETNGLGKVKVSVLMNELKELQALWCDSGNEPDSDGFSGTGSDSTQSEELQAVKFILDPSDNDPDIDLATFTKGITSYLEKKNFNSALSPIKCSSAMGDEEERGMSTRRSSWIRRTDTSCTSQSSAFHLNISSLSEQNLSLEALAGTSTSSFLENGDDNGPDLQAEISDLHLQIQKLNEDNALLKSRVRAAQDENFQLLQSQREELDKKELGMKCLMEKVKRLERDLQEKSTTIQALEDKVTIMTNRNVRLENESSCYMKERKELLLENDELKAEVKKTLNLLTHRDETIAKLKNAISASTEESLKRENLWTERSDMQAVLMQELETKVEQLLLEKMDLEAKLTALKTDTETDNSRRYSRLSSSGVHSQSFDLDVSTDDIQTELIAADCFSSPTSLSPEPLLSLRFDAAVQCELWDAAPIAHLVALCTQLAEVREAASELCTTTLQTVQPSGDLWEAGRPAPPSPDGETKGKQLRNGSSSNQKHTPCSGERREETKKNGVGGGSSTVNETLMTESSVNSVVKQIHDELAEFKEQLKKSQELFTVLRINSSQSFSKSCPGLAIDSSGFEMVDGSPYPSSKVVSCSTQTDSPVIETPVLAQKLCLGSVPPPLLYSQQSSPLSLLPGSGGGPPPYIPNDSMDNPSFDKLSDDGSVRVRDDLSMVLELSELEGETSPGTAQRTMSFAKDGSSRPRLKKQSNAKEDEDMHHPSNILKKNDGEMSSSGNNSAHNSHLLNPDDLQSENDYVSATSSQAESVYLSLERPLKVTPAGSSSSGKMEGDRSSGGFRSCASSSIKSGRHFSREDYRQIDSDSASVVSEGNTTFGSPLSSPSSPYWTPSQGSSSQETLTPLDGREDGDRTPVNEHAAGDDDHHSSSDNYFSAGGRSNSRSGSVGPSPHLKPSGRIHENEMNEMMMRTFCVVERATDSKGKILSPGEWRQLRRDRDHNDKEEYRKTFAQEEGNEDDGVVGMDGGSSIPSTSTYAFALDEEAEKYLECLPNLAEKLFQALDVIREKKDEATREDMEDLERKFNHMAEIFQTEHTNLEQRRDTISKDLTESQANLKSISYQLKDCHSKLKECSAMSDCVPMDALLDVMKTLASIADEFELYSSSVCRNARRMGMMDVQSRLHKMVDVMVLYVHIIRAKYQKLDTDYKNLHGEFVRASDLMKEKGVTFRSNHPIDSLQKHNNNNEEKQSLWEQEELEGSPTDMCDDGESEPDKIAWHEHLLAPKKSNSGLGRGKERPLVKEKQSDGNLFVRWLTDGCEVLRRELFWPWNLEQTIKGLKQAFSVMLMILGLFVFLRGFLPSVNAIDDGCMMTNPSFFKNVGSYFSYCGQLSHDEAPVI